MQRICPRCQRRFAAEVDTCPNDGARLRDDPFIGAHIGRWRLTGFVGQGAMGVVYAAEPTAAIKILHARRAAMQPELVRRFEVEAQAAMRMTSRHIARVFDSGTTEDGHLYIAMELLRGEPLDAILARSPRLPPAAAATIAHQIASALEEAHAADVVHRDLKPANIFVEPAPGGGRHVRVLDFGVARINSESVARSRTGSVAGTPAFMSPEQLRGEPDIDGRSDIYSLGVVLYLLLAGVNPFRGPGGVMGTLRRHLELNPPPIEGIPPLLDDIVHRMLLKHRDTRPQTMAMVQQLLALTGLVGGGGDSQTIPGISREMLAAAGVYEAAPDPELRPLVKPFVRPDAPSGAPPSTPGAPPIPPPSTPPVEPAMARPPAQPSEASDPALRSDPPPPSIDEAPETPRAPSKRRRGWLWVTGLVAVGALAGLGFVWADGAASDAAVEAPRPVADPAPGSTTTPQSPPDITGVLTEGQAALGARRWQEARGHFDEALQQIPGHEAAAAGRATASKEANALRLLRGVQEAIDVKWWVRALSTLDDFPRDSVYTAEAEALRPTAEAGYIQEQLTKARQLIEQGRARSAEPIQAELAKRSFGLEAAEQLALEIAAARRRKEEKRAKATKQRDDQPAKLPPRPTPSTQDLSFDQLVRRSLQEMVRGDRDAAIVLLKMAERKRPRSHVPHQRLCAIYKAKQRYKPALAHCKKWRDLEPNVSYRGAIQRNIEQLQELIDK